VRACVCMCVLCVYVLCICMCVLCVCVVCGRVCCVCVLCKTSELIFFHRFNDLCSDLLVDILKISSLLQDIQVLIFEYTI